MTNTKRKDRLIKSLAREGRVMIYINETTNLVEENRVAHDLWPTSAAALGRTLSIGSIMGSMLKSDEEKIIIQINGGGPIGTIMVDARSDGGVRGFVGDPHQYLTYNDTKKLAVGLAVGKEGTLRVTKDLAMKDTFGGTVALQSGEIGDDFAYYFALSEQRPSIVSLGVLVSKENTILASGGLLIQMMPDATEEDIKISEQLVSKLKPMTTYLNDGLTLEQILEQCYDDIKILETQELLGYCNCSKDKYKRVLITLTSEERLDMINNDHGCECVCQFCGKRYNFSEEELLELNTFIERYQK